MIKEVLIVTLGITLFSACSSQSNENIINFGKDFYRSNLLINNKEVSGYNSFDRSDLAKIRPQYLLNGISNKEINLILKLPGGNNKLIAYLETGLTESAYLDLYVNDSLIKYKWQDFAPPAEGRTDIQKTFRIINLDLNLSSDSLVLKFIGKKDLVRLLALAIYPITEYFDKVPKDLDSTLKAIGKLDSDWSSDKIREFKSSRIGKGNSVLYDYLTLKLEEFSLAIDLFEMKGWEWGTEKYGLTIFDRLHQCVMLLDGIIGDPWLEVYLGDRSKWLRGRLLWWLNQERGGSGEISTAREDISFLREKYPENELIKMYDGEKVDSPDPYDNLLFDEEIPEWSKLQHEAIGRLSSEIDWWVNKRQAENGELGGKIGDDVEILRWWSALTAFGDTTAIQGWKRLSDAVWNNPKVYMGYSRKPIDVEHSAEFIADAFPEMIYFSANNSERYLKPSAEYFTNLWTSLNKFGRRFFKSSWFSSTEVITDPPKDRDLPMNTRAVKAVRYYAWSTGDETITEALYEWSEAWKEMALRTQKGKPVGVFPASVRSNDEQFNGDGETWYEADMFWNYFDWEASGGVRFYDQLLYSYITQKDETLLEPLKITLGLIEKYGNYSGEIVKGTKEWAAKIILNDHRFWNIVTQYRTFTNDKSFDHLIAKYGTPYSKYLVTKDKKYILEGLNNLLSDIRYNVPLRTTEVIHTDRVRTFDIITLKGMLTGNDAYETDSPFLAVTYEDTSNDLTILLEENSLNQLVISFYSHGDNVINPTLRIWLLENGLYNSLLTDKNNNVIMNSNIEINERGERIKLTILPRNELKFTLNRKINLN